MITITLNGAPREVPPGSTLAELVGTLAATPQSLATSV